MLNRIPCVFFLIRYVPNVVTGEFVNIGVLLRERALTPKAGATTEVRFTRQWDRVLRLDPNADIELLQALADDISARLKEESISKNLASILTVMQDSFSNSVQVSHAQASLADTMSGEMDRLIHMYVDVQVEEQVSTSPVV